MNLTITYEISLIFLLLFRRLSEAKLVVKFTSVSIWPALHNLVYLLVQKLHQNSPLAFPWRPIIWKENVILSIHRCSANQKVLMTLFSRSSFISLREFIFSHTYLRHLIVSHTITLHHCKFSLTRNRPYTCQYTKIIWRVFNKSIDFQLLIRQTIYDTFSRCEGGKKLNCSSYPININLLHSCAIVIQIVHGLIWQILFKRNVLWSKSFFLNQDLVKSLINSTNEYQIIKSIRTTTNLVKSISCEQVFLKLSDNLT